MNNANRWRAWLLGTEFAALLVMLGSMYLLGHQSPETPGLNPAWLLVPALSSLVLFLSFLCLTYMRWFLDAPATGTRGTRKGIFVLLALTLIGVWVFAMHQTWQRLQQADAIQHTTKTSQDQKLHNGPGGQPVPNGSKELNPQ